MARQWAWSGLVLGSAVFIALIISGGIFTLSPLVGLRVAHTSGTSMEPGLKSGDVVLIKDVAPNDLKVGDVVVFSALNTQFMHRIIERRTGPDGELMLVTQGDNVPKPDFPIRASQVTGKLVGEIPLLGSVSRLLNAQGGLYVYRSAVLSVAVSAVAVWGLAVSARGKRRPSLVRETPDAAGDEPKPEA
jgi:signal peptidase I